MILLSHATGNENVRQAGLALQEVDLLGEFWTCLSWNPDAAINQVLPQQLRDQLSRRSFPKSIRPFVHTAPSREIGRLFFGLFGVDSVLQHLDHKVASRLQRAKNLTAIYAYEDGALDSFRVAQQRRIHRIYDLPIGYWRVAQQIYAEEREREPEWAVTLTGTRDSEEKLARKEEELKLAQRVVVASSFTKQTLTGANFAGAISVISYGAPIVTKEEIVPHAGKLRVLFVGSLGQRKGLSYLLRAVESLGADVELTLLGRKTIANCPALETALRKYRWIPSLSRPEMLAEMRRHDVLVLPSLFEGFGLVILEAMAQGLVVITTPHTAGPDFIADGLDGFIVPIRCAEAIAQKLEMLSRQPAQTHEMKLAARRKAKEKRWQDYRRRLGEMAREVVS